MLNTDNCMFFTSTKHLSRIVIKDILQNEIYYTDINCVKKTSVRRFTMS